MHPSDEEFIAALTDAITRPMTDAELAASPFGSCCGCAILQTIPAHIPAPQDPEVTTT